MHSENKQRRSTNEQHVRVEKVLNFIDPDCEREKWMYVGMGVHDELGEDGWLIWDGWSARGNSYNKADATSVWKSFRQGGGKGFGYVVNLAKEQGFNPRGKSKPFVKKVLVDREVQKKESHQKQAVEKAKKAEDARTKAQERWDDAKPAPPDHPYLKRKGVQPHTLRVGKWPTTDKSTGETIWLENVLLLPIKNRHGELQSLQGILPNATGSKFFLADGAKHGNFYAIGKKSESVDSTPEFHFAEGFATAASAHEVTGKHTLCCYDAGNLVHVVRSVREALPQARLVILADNDIHTETEGKGNVGMRKAFEVALETGAFVAHVHEGGDFNDLRLTKGDEAVRGLIEAAVVPTAPYSEKKPAKAGAKALATSAVRIRATLSDELCADDEALEITDVKEANRPKIMVERNNVKVINDLAEQALIAACPFLYSRGGEIVRPMIATAPDGRGGIVRTVKIRPLKRAALHEQLDAAARWMKYDGRSKAYVAVDAPMTVADALLARGASSLRPLNGVIEAPTLRADGSILDTPGYDAQTGLLFQPSCEYPMVPKEPQMEDALAALKRIEAVIDKYPYTSPVDRSVALAAILTCAIRRALSKAPMFAMSAPAPGSGKSALVDVASIIVTGSTVPVFAHGENEAEFEKRLHGALLAGHSLVSFDNVTRPIEGNALCQAITQQTMEVRPLGTSDTRTVPTSSTFFTTGNALVVCGDMTRRVLECRLDPGVERPEMRTFDFNPLTVAKAQRATLHVDALTVIRAHCLVQQNVRSRRFDFDEWSTKIADALVWLGYADPAESMDRTRANDPARDEFRDVARGWRECVGDRLVPVREVISAANSQQNEMFGTRTEFKHPDFREALLHIAGAKGEISGKQLGKWLARHVNFLVDGMTVLKRDGPQGAHRWGFGQAVIATDNLLPL